MTKFPFPRGIVIGEGPPRWITNEPAETFDFVICMRAEELPNPPPDNETGPCAHCLRMMSYRPGHPESVKKVCTYCAEDMVKAGGVQ